MSDEKEVVPHDSSYHSVGAVSAAPSMYSESLYSASTNLRRTVSYSSIGGQTTLGPHSPSTPFEADTDADSVMPPSTIDWEEPPPYEINLVGRGGNVSAEVQSM